MDFSASPFFQTRARGRRASNDSKLAKLCSTHSATVGNQGNSPSAAISLLHRHCSLRTWQFHTVTPCLDLQQTSQTVTPALHTLSPFFFSSGKCMCFTFICSSQFCGSFIQFSPSSLLLVLRLSQWLLHRKLWAGFIFQNGNKS